MYTLKNISLVLACMLALCACEKEGSTNNIEAEGIWVGVWGLGSTTPANYEKWEFKPSAKMSAYNSNGAILANGTWHLNQTDIEIEYTPFGLSSGLIYSGTYDSVQKKITGIWGWEPSKTDGGKFEMNKQE